MKTIHQTKILSILLFIVLAVIITLGTVFCMHEKAFAYARIWGEPDVLINGKYYYKWVTPSDHPIMIDRKTWKMDHVHPNREDSILGTEYHDCYSIKTQTIFQKDIESIYDMSFTVTDNSVELNYKTDFRWDKMAEDFVVYIDVKYVDSDNNVQTKQFSKEWRDKYDSDGAWDSVEVINQDFGCDDETVAEMIMADRMSISVNCLLLD